MFAVAPRGITNSEIEGLIPNLSSAVLMDKGITAAELEVEKARSITSRIAFRNSNGLYLATRETIMRFRHIRSSRLTSTVPTYTAIPRRVSMPIFIVNFVRSPKTAIGARDMLHLTTVMQTACTEVRKLTIGTDWSLFRDIRAIPIITAIMTTCNISPLARAPSGLEGSRPPISSEGSVRAEVLKLRSDPA
ncbi:hypothetical protein SDC9_170101 [bioreactor metagenome]|uniref:Uncharacterized protein n=1 Tax=bioreactor metagenome TaxID=1076179 RepID=A0A645G762_9ZZZZ